MSKAKIKMVIEEGEPIPDAHGNQKYPWHYLEVGQNLKIIVEEGEDAARIRKNAYQSCAHWIARRELPLKPVSRITENGNVRVWIAPRDEDEDQESP